MKRRQFITLIGGATAAWPLASRAQTAGVKRVGVLSAFGDTVGGRMFLAAVFVQRLRELGWIEGRNVSIEQRWSGGDDEQLRADARALASLPADVIFAIATPAVAVLKQEAPAIPVVFAALSDPVGSGFVESLPRPGGNITGFINLEGSLSGKWLQLLKDVVPGLTHVGFMYNPETASFADYYLRPFETAAAKMAVMPMAMPVHNASDIETAILAMRARPSGALVVMPDAFTTIHRAQIIALAARERVPSVHASGGAARQGGLIGYGVDNTEATRGAADYVDRILKGTKPADLPVQTPTKFEMVINLKTARALGLSIPPTLRALADEVIE